MANCSCLIELKYFYKLHHRVVPGTTEKVKIPKPDQTHSLHRNTSLPIRILKYTACLYSIIGILLGEGVNDFLG